MVVKVNPWVADGFERALLPSFKVTLCKGIRWQSLCREGARQCRSQERQLYMARGVDARRRKERSRFSIRSSPSNGKAPARSNALRPLAIECAALASSSLLSRRGQRQRSRQCHSPGIVGACLDVGAVASRIPAGRPGYRARLAVLVLCRSRVQDRHSARSPSASLSSRARNWL